MTINRKFLYTIMSLGFGCLLFYTIFGENGLRELLLLQQEKNALLKKNQELVEQNTKIYSEIDRLINDPEYIEQVARKELKMVLPDELIYRQYPQKNSRKYPKKK
jgi:cell division protein FtsB